VRAAQRASSQACYDHKVDEERVADPTEPKIWRRGECCALIRDVVIVGGDGVRAVTRCSCEPRLVGWELPG